MNDRTDRPTAMERAGAVDCLVELLLAWLQRPLDTLTERARGEAIQEACLYIGQLRHLAPAPMDVERRRWIERVRRRLCAQILELRGHEGGLDVELERWVTAMLLRYHDWREQYALPLAEQAATQRRGSASPAGSATGPSDGGEVPV